MTTRKKAVTHKASQPPVLTLTQRIERLERHYFAQKPAVPSSGPRFTVQGDVVSDRTTGLTWTRKNLGGKRLNWKDAQAACKASRLGGHEDWRLPTIQELLSLVDYSRVSPAIDITAFECESSWYWSATPYASSPGAFAWCVSFNNGLSHLDGQSDGSCVRAVRPGHVHAIPTDS